MVNFLLSFLCLVLYYLGQTSSALSSSVSSSHLLQQFHEADTLVIDAEPGQERERRRPEKLSTEGYSFLPPVLLYRHDGILKCITQEGEQGQCISFKECHPILFSFDEPGGKAHNLVLRDEVLATTTPCFAGRDETPVPSKIRQAGGRNDEDIICCTTGNGKNKSNLSPPSSSSSSTKAPSRPTSLISNPIPEEYPETLEPETTPPFSYPNGGLESEEQAQNQNANHSATNTEDSGEGAQLLQGPHTPRPNIHGNRPPIMRQNVSTSTEASAVAVPSNCGMTKVVNVPAGVGAIAPRNGYPFMAALMNSQRMQFCGGALIDNWHVLTASHCISHYKKPEQVAKLLVYLGSHNVYAGSETGRDIRKVAKILKHAQYSERTFENDIAILRLDKAVVFSPAIQPICLNNGSNYDDGKKKAVLAGWGRTSASGAPSPILRHGTMRIWTNSECQARYKQYFGIQAVPNIAPTMTCAGEPGLVDACQGDSGGPLFLNEQGRYEQVGIVSWGIGCGLYPGVYTRVSAYNAWISKNQKLSLKNKA